MLHPGRDASELPLEAASDAREAPGASPVVPKALEWLARSVQLFAQVARDVANEAGVAAAGAQHQRALVALSDVLYEAIADGASAWREVTELTAAKRVEPQVGPRADFARDAGCVVCDEPLTERDEPGLCRHCAHEMQSLCNEWLR